MPMPLSSNNQMRICDLAERRPEQGIHHLQHRAPSCVLGTERHPAVPPVMDRITVVTACMWSGAYL